MGFSDSFRQRDEAMTPRVTQLLQPRYSTGGMAFPDRPSPTGGRDSDNGGSGVSRRGFSASDQYPIFDLEPPQACRTIWDAAETGRTKIISQLVREHRKKSPAESRKAPLVDKKDKTGRTPLMLAAEGGHVEAVNELLKEGANVMVKTPDGRTALHWAARSGQDNAGEVIAALLKSVERFGGTEEVETQLNMEDDAGLTPLVLAKSKADLGLPAFEFLLKSGARFNKKKMSMAAAATVMMGAFRWKKKLASRPTTAAAPEDGNTPPTGNTPRLEIEFPFASLAASRSRGCSTENLEALPTPPPLVAV